MEINNKTCESCTNYNVQQESKMFGHPCNIHGTANSYECYDYSKDPNTIEWYVYYHDFNHDKLIKWNIFNNWVFKEAVEKLIKDKNITKKEFSEQIKGQLMYRFWSKCEYEIVISSLHFSSKHGVEEKIDIYDQVMLNFDKFVNYLWLLKEEK